MAEVARAGAPAAAFSSRPRTVRIAGGGAPSPYPSTSSRPTRCPRRRRGLLVPFGCRAPTEASSPWPLLDAVEDDPDPSEPPRTTPSSAGAAHWTVSEPMSRDTDAASAVASTADVSRELAAELLDVGAVYAECWPEGEGEGKPTRWRRIADRKIVAKGEVIRVHKRPRRYRHACWLGADAWRHRVVHEDDAILVVNKPHRLPSMAHESNGVEHCAGCLERSLGLPPSTLRVTHRLDSSTSGVLVLGKTAEAVREFNESVAKTPGSKEIVKSYAALVYAKHAVPLGLMTHWMYPGPFGPGAFHGRTLRRSRARLLRSSADGERGDDTGGQGTGKRWKRCELRVVSCDRATQSQVDTWRTLFDRELERARKPFDGGADDPLVSGGDSPGGDSPGASVWVVRVELVTGRTHQVRAQLAAAGAPLLGDSLYAPMAGYLHDRDDERAAEEAWGRMERGTVPDWPVALHAETLRWGDSVFSTSPPWD